MKQASNFGLDLNTLYGPTTYEHLTDTERSGHTLATLQVTQAVQKSSMDFIISMRALIDAAEKEGLEVEDSYGVTTILKALSTKELDSKVADAQKEWTAGLRAYLWIAADESNKLGPDKKYDSASGGYKAFTFQQRAIHMGYTITPFWELKYTTLTGYEYLPEEMGIEHFTKAKDSPLDGEVLGA